MLSQKSLNRKAEIGYRMPKGDCYEPTFYEREAEMNYDTLYEFERAMTLVDSNDGFHAVGDKVSARKLGNLKFKQILTTEPYTTYTNLNPKE